MKKIICFFLSAVLACSFLACDHSGTPSDYSFESLERALADANSLDEAEIFTENVSKVHYEATTLKKYDLDTEQSAKTAFRRDESGKLSALSASYTLKTTEESSFSVYYEDGYAYYDQDGRFFKEEVDVSLIDDRSLFVGFEKDEVEAYHATEKKGVITVTFSVPWESSSEKIVSLYGQLAEVMQATGLEVRNVRYKDLSATYKVDKASGALMEYTYEYSAEMEVNEKKVTVKGSASCTISKTDGVVITPPDLTLYK